jgi:HEAT repeat protein
VEEGSAETVAEWTARLGSSDKSVRLEAINALAQRGGAAAEAVDALLQQLDHDDLDIRASAAVALGMIGAEEDKVVPTLIEHFSDRGYIVRHVPKFEEVPIWAIYGEAIAGFGAQAVDPLIEALGSDSPQVYVAAAIGLEGIGEPAAKATPVLIEMLESQDTIRRNTAAGAIRGIGPGAAPAIPALVKLLHEENFHTQYWVCRALGAIGPASAVATEDLLGLMAEGSASVRRNAAEALGNIGPEIGAEAAAKLIEAADEDFMAPVRENAVIALGKLKPFAAESVPAIKRLLATPGYNTPTHAARSLWLLTGDPDEALPTLIQGLDDLTYFQHAIEVLGEMGEEAAPAVDRLIEALGEPDPDDRLATAETLAKIGPPAAKAMEPLRKLLEDENQAVREAAQAAMTKLSQ